MRAKARELTQGAGSPYLGEAGTEHDVANAAGAPAVFVEIELKDVPRAPAASARGDATVLAAVDADGGVRTITERRENE